MIEKAKKLQKLPQIPSMIFIIKKIPINIQENDENDKFDERLNYDFLNDSNNLLNNHEMHEEFSFLKDLENLIKDFKCKGCGIELQCSKREKLGYIPDKKVKQYLEGSDGSNKPNEIEKIKLEDLNLENIEIPKDTDYIKKLTKKKLKKSDLICERCFKLQNYMRLSEKDHKLSHDADKNDKSEEGIKLDNYSLLIKKIDSQKLIQQILIRLSAKSHVFYLCDITDFEPSINLQIIRELKNKKCGLTFIVNKFDVLPNDVNEERIRVWVGERLKELTSNIEGINYNYIIVSSKNGHNFDYVIHNIKGLKQKAKENRILKPKVFLIGNANAGKSSFINKLIQTSNKFLSDERRKKKLYKKNYQITDPTLVNLEEEGEIQNAILNEAENNQSPNITIESLDKSDIENIEEPNLTTSPLPGTTIGITKVNSMTMGIKIFDSPGIPNLTSISYLMNNYINMIATYMIKKIKPYSVNVKQGYSMWLGALARIDMLNGEDKIFTFFLSHDVTFHKTFLLNAERIFENQAGNLLRPVISEKLEDLNLVSHNFNLKCEKFKLLNYDICISGLGWFSISGKGFLQIDVLVPKGVKVYLRHKPLMPFEIKQGGVKKYFGNTINANSKLNRKMREEKQTNFKSGK